MGAPSLPAGEKDDGVRARVGDLRGGPGRYASWRDAERIAVNVDTAWREWSGGAPPPDALALFGHMARLHCDKR